MSLAFIDSDGVTRSVSPDKPLPVTGGGSDATGIISDPAYAGFGDASVVSLLKGIYNQLAVIATNTTPAP
jgi:hypothetical protein